MSRITIEMIGRRPISIDGSEWPVVVRVDGDSFGGCDYNRHQQALARGEVDVFSIRVRRHADGRHLVYGWVDAAPSCWHQPACGRDRRGGIVTDEAGIVDAIRSVTKHLNLPEWVEEQAIDSLPAEEV